MYKNSADLLSATISSLFDVYHGYYTRVSSLLHVPVGHTRLIYKTFRFSALKIWNYVKPMCLLLFILLPLKMQLNVICLKIMFINNTYLSYH